MIRLPAQLPEKRTIALGLGVTVDIKPVTTAAMETARADARRSLEGLVEQARERQKAGLDLGDLPDPDDEPALDGIFYGLVTRALAVRHVVAWDGVGNADGSDAAPCTPETVAALMLCYPFGERFMAAATADALAMVAQKKSFTSGPAGTGAAASPIAGPAPKPTSPAPAANPAATASSAPMSSTG